MENEYILFKFTTRNQIKLSMVKEFHFKMNIVEIENQEFTFY